MVALDKGWIDVDPADSNSFKIIGVSAVYLDADTFYLGNTVDINGNPEVNIVDNGDGTWTATEVVVYPGREVLKLIVNPTPPDPFEIDGADAVYTDADTFVIGDTTDENGILLLSIIDNGDGTWTATSFATGKTKRFTGVGWFSAPVRTSAGLIKPKKYFDGSTWKATP